MQIEFRSMKEVADHLAGLAKERGLSVRALCDEADVSRQGFYNVASKGTSLGADSLTRLCDFLAVPDDLRVAVFYAYLRERLNVGVLAGPFRVALRVIDSLPAKRRAAIITEMVKSIDDGRSPR